MRVERAKHYIDLCHQSIQQLRHVHTVGVSETTTYVSSSGQRLKVSYWVELVVFLGHTSRTIDKKFSKPTTSVVFRQ